jgi:hypothetical protein
MNQREYGPFVRDLGGGNELRISTYPADFPDRLTPKGKLYQRYESAGAVYFQVNIRDKSKGIGRNENVESIMIHSFAYRLSDAPPTVLLSDYDYNFWMQDNPRYESRDLPPIAYKPDGHVSIEIHFTLNGETYRYQGDMAARENTTTMPTVLAKQGI